MAAPTMAATRQSRMRERSRGLWRAANMSGTERVRAGCAL
jgi:hypothetical protein